MFEILNYTKYLKSLIRTVTDVCILEVGIKMSNLVITTMYLKDGDSIETVVPVVMNIAGDVNHNVVVKYVISLSYYIEISSLWVPLLP